MKPLLLLRACYAVTGRALRSLALLSVVGHAFASRRQPLQLLFILGIAANPVRATDLPVSGNLTVSGTSALTGNVGIGTASTGAKLQVMGDTYLGGVGSDGSFRLYDDSATGTGSYITFSNSAGKLTITGGGGSASVENTIALRGHNRADLDNTYNLGDPSFRWKSLQVGTADSSFAGNVGIGVPDPGGKLDVHDLVANGADHRAIRLEADIAITGGTGTYYNMGLAVQKNRYSIPSGVTANGYQRGVDIRTYVNDTNFQGTITDQTSLFVENGIYVAGGSGERTITDSYGIYISSLANAGTISNLYGLYQSASNAKNYFAGNVGIGTTSPSHKLAVNGTIRAKEVIVDTGWSDYVFDDDYRLAPLSEVEAHIKTEKHLPGIPSAAEVAAGGVSLGDMQARLLAKVEELTLHVIELKKENYSLQARLTRLESTISP